MGPSPAVPDADALPPPRHLPFEAGPHRLAMGLRALKPAEWIEIDGRRVADLAEKRRLLADRPADVTAALPGSEVAAAEARARLAEALATHHPTLFRLEGGVLHDPEGRAWALDDPARAPLDMAGRWVQEDLCLMERQPQGWVLTAASLCFPNRWRLADKLGRPMGAIHTPVPGYAARLEAPVDRFFDKLAADRGVWRLNWGVQADAALFQPTGHNAGEAEGADVTPQTAPDRLVLRVERQTLVRLPASGAIVFGIRTHVHPLRAVIGGDAATAARLAAAVRALPPEMTAYKSMTGFRAALLTWLDATAAAGAVASGPAIMETAS